MGLPDESTALSAADAERQHHLASRYAVASGICPKTAPDRLFAAAKCGNFIEA
jgi:hypothetical protein